MIIYRYTYIDAILSFILIMTYENRNVVINFVSLVINIPNSNTNSIYKSIFIECNENQGLDETQFIVYDNI